MRTHVWNKEDAILTLYYTKFGVKHLPVKDATEFAEHLIGSSMDSLVLQSANIRHLLGEEGFKLSDYSKDQKDAVNEYSSMSEEGLRVVVDRIIDKRDINGNIRHMSKRRIEKQRKVFKDQSQKDLEAKLRSMGFDPSKMKRVQK